MCVCACVWMDVCVCVCVCVCVRARARMGVYGWVGVDGVPSQIGDSLVAEARMKSAARSGSWFLFASGG